VWGKRRHTHWGRAATWSTPTRVKANVKVLKIANVEVLSTDVLSRLGLLLAVCQFGEYAGLALLA
jgi:hypothetical protein